MPGISQDFLAERWYELLELCLRKILAHVEHLQLCNVKVGIELLQATEIEFTWLQRQSNNHLPAVKIVLGTRL